MTQMARHKIVLGPEACLLTSIDIGLSWLKKGHRMSTAKKTGREPQRRKEDRPLWSILCWGEYHNVLMLQTEQFARYQRYSSFVYAIQLINHVLCMVSSFIVTYLCCFHRTSCVCQLSERHKKHQEATYPYETEWRHDISFEIFRLTNCKCTWWDALIQDLTLIALNRFYMTKMLKPCS